MEPRLCHFDGQQKSMTEKIIISYGEGSRAGLTMPPSLMVWPAIAAFLSEDD